MPKPGIRLSGLKIQSLVPRLVRTCVTLVEKRPYSAANGFDSTSTDSTAPLGSSRSKSPVDGSLRLALLICSAPVVGAPPLMRSRPSGPRMMLGQHRQQRLKVVAGERLDVHLRAGQHVAHRHRLQALGRRVGGDDDLDALADERQPHLDEHLSCLAALHHERRRLAVGEPLADRLDDVAAGRHVGKRHLADRVADRLRDRDIAVDVTQLDVHGRNAKPFDHDRDDDASGGSGGGLRGWCLPGRPPDHEPERVAGCAPATPGPHRQSTNSARLVNLKSPSRIGTV